MRGVLEKIAMSAITRGRRGMCYSGNPRKLFPSLFFFLHTGEYIYRHTNVDGTYFRGRSCRSPVVHRAIGSNNNNNKQQMTHRVKEEV